MNILHEMHEAGECHPEWQMLYDNGLMLKSSVSLLPSVSRDGMYFISVSSQYATMYVTELQAVLLAKVGPQEAILLVRRVRGSEE